MSFRGYWAGLNGTPMGTSFRYCSAVALPSDWPLIFRWKLNDRWLRRGDEADGALKETPFERLYEEFAHWGALILD